MTVVAAAAFALCLRALTFVGSIMPAEAVTLPTDARAVGYRCNPTMKQLTLIACGDGFGEYRSFHLHAARTRAQLQKPPQSRGLTVSLH